MPKKEISPFIYNPRTDTIFQYVENQLYVPGRVPGVEKHKRPLREHYQIKKTVYAQVKSDGTINYRKQFSGSNSKNTYIHHFKNLIAVKYFRAKLKYEMHQDILIKQQWKQEMDNIIEHFPEFLI